VRVEEQIATLMARCVTVPIVPRLQQALLKTMTSVLTAGDTSSWLGPGRTVVERSWEHPTFGITLCGALSDLHWGGWKMIALPKVLKITKQTSEAEPHVMLRLLATLHRAKLLGGADMVWKTQVDVWVSQRLSAWKPGESSVVELNHILALSTLVSTMSQHLVRIVKVVLESQDSTIDRPVLAELAWILGSCMRGLAGRRAEEWNAHVDIVSWASMCAEKWAWSDFVLGSLAKLIHTR
jgi:U3 small nucleolar RNA-associated protein 20